MVNDILLFPLRVMDDHPLVPILRGGPEGARWASRHSSLGLVWLEPRDVAGQLGWVDLLGISGLLIFCTQNAIFRVETSIIIGFLDLFACLTILCVFFKFFEPS